MARQSGKTMKVDVALPLNIYDTVVRLAEESDAPIHHRSNQRVLSPTILRLIGLGIESLEDNPELLKTPMNTGSGGNDPRVGALLEKVGKLEEKIVTCEDGLSDTLTRDEIQALIGDRVAEAIAFLQSSEIAAEDIESKPIQYFASLDDQLASKPQPASVRTTLANGKPKGKTAARPRPDGSIALVTFAKEHGIAIVRGTPAEEVRAMLKEKGLDKQYRYAAGDKYFIPINSADE